MSANAYRRAPLVDPAYVTLSDSVVHTSGEFDARIKQALALVDVNRFSILDAILATKLGSYTQTPPMPDVRDAAASLPGDARPFADTVRAASLIAVMNRDKAAILEVLAALRAFGEVLPSMTEEALFAVGADLLRVAVDAYRRTGQRFLLKLMEDLRSRLPDVAGVMHMFPFTQAYRPDTAPHTPDEQAYYSRMERLATGSLTADAMAMTSLLSQFSGSGREAAAAQAGLGALMRYHGLPTGVFSADPYLAGRDPSRSAELYAVAAQAEALLDALTTGGEPVMAEQLEAILTNVLPDLLTPAGVRELSPVNRLPGDESCSVTRDPEAVSQLLRLLYALRRSLWLSRDDDNITCMMPVSGGCVTRLGGVPVRLTAECTGVTQKQLTLRIECREAAAGTVRIRVPAYAENAMLRFGEEDARPAEAGKLADVRRTFHSGDVITLTYDAAPRMERGFRGSVSFYAGARLMALALPNDGCEWRYAALASAEITGGEENGEPRLYVTACAAPSWQQKDGIIRALPQDVTMSDAYTLTLIPFAGTAGRIASFPCVREQTR